MPPHRSPPSARSPARPRRISQVRPAPATRRGRLGLAQRAAASARRRPAARAAGPAQDGALPSRTQQQEPDSEQHPPSTKARRSQLAEGHPGHPRPAAWVGEGVRQAPARSQTAPSGTSHARARHVGALGTSIPADPIQQFRPRAVSPSRHRAAVARHSSAPGPRRSAPRPRAESPGLAPPGWPAQASGGDDGAVPPTQQGRSRASAEAAAQRAASRPRPSEVAQPGEGTPPPAPSRSSSAERIRASVSPPAGQVALERRPRSIRAIAERPAVALRRSATVSRSATGRPRSRPAPGPACEDEERAEARPRRPPAPGTARGSPPTAPPPAGARQGLASGPRPMACPASGGRAPAPGGRRAPATARRHSSAADRAAAKA